MPLLDHFHPPVSVSRQWQSFYAAWLTQLADAVNGLLPPEHFAEERVR